MVETLVRSDPTFLTDSDSKDFSYRTVPHNIPAEQALIGATLINNEVVNRIGDFLTTEHFYEPVHQRIYDAILKCLDRGIIATPVTLKHYFDKDEALESVGGAEYLAKLASLATTIINVEAYARTIYDLAIRRRLIALGEDVVNNAYEPKVSESALEQIEKAEQELFNLASEGAVDRGFQMLKTSLTGALERIETAFKRKEKISGISSGFTDLDHYLGGLQKSDLLILAGRPSMGKTALAINIAINACKILYQVHGTKNDPTTLPPGVGFFSLEMSAEQLAARMIAMETGINSSKMRIGNLNNEEFAKLVQGNKSLYELPFFIDDTPALSISALRTRARRLKRKYNLGLLLIDYLQLVRGTSKMSESNRVQEVSEITQGLKAIAKELDIPVMALSQLSRAVEQRTDKKPQLSDLRESGSIEQDADVVMFIYREEYYLLREQPQENTPQHAEWQEKMNKAMNLTEVIIGKQRNGPVGSVSLFFDSNTTQFRDLAEQDHIPSFKPY